MNSMRVGHGYDAHRFTGSGEEARPLVLGGVIIPHDRGLAAHSDGDALIHALCDALLGALGRGDIGQHFPDADETWRDADSALLLQQVVGMLHAEGWKVANADMTVLAQTPKLAPYRDAMRQRLAALLQMDGGMLNIKASTTEGMGFVGRGEGIEAYAVVLVYR